MPTIELRNQINPAEIQDGDRITFRVVPAGEYMTPGVVYTATIAGKHVKLSRDSGSTFTHFTRLMDAFSDWQKVN